MSDDQLKTLGAEHGAYSVVTEREAERDRSITIDANEKEVVGHCYPLDSFTRRGGAVPDGKPERFEFLIHNRGSLSEWAARNLAIRYPKSEGNELRLYMSASDGFYAKTNDIFYIYTVAGSDRPHIGFIARPTWDGFWESPLLPEATDSSNPSDDIFDEVFQREIGGVARGSVFKTSRMQYPRNPQIALDALKRAGFRCEIDPSHATFRSAASGNQFVEAHHLIPMAVQNQFESSLDVTENIISLCPTCHKHIHFGTDETRVPYLEMLYARRMRDLAIRDIGVALDVLLRAYGTRLA
ncbi:hypothetical protein GTP23_12735 [Pseudoduganella sp. FT93W]|uniref:HNH domain-containing protein n=1 Tax=Duganella fentianensis TaxID=2692177 RepID=A0A845HWY9_9BURK|nr:HNH endonuclease [Duganella fentianensis]MYN45914.1 hypothetical protein [Duganella fentianensis]